MINVGLCDDDDLVRRLLPESLRTDDIDVVVTCGSGEEALASEVDVDVWLVDLRMPGIDGRETAQRLIQANPAVKVMILTAFGDERVRETLACGATAYLHKDAAPGELREAIRTVHSGYTVLAPGMALSALERDDVELGLREIGADDLDRHIVTLMSAGQSYQDMAAEVGMSVSGVKKRASKLMRALRVGSRSQLVAKLNGLRP